MEEDRAAFERHLREMAGQHRDEYTRIRQEIFGDESDVVEPPPNLSDLPLDQALVAFESWARRCTRTTRSEFSRNRARERPLATAAPGWGERFPGQPERELGRLDHLIDGAFDLDRWLPQTRPAHGIHYCLDLQSYAEPLVRHLGWAASDCNGLIRAVEGGAAGVPLLGEPAYDLHGLGTFVNGWLLGRQRHTAPHRALDGDAGDLARILGLVAAVRWGRGFLDTYTTLGQEIWQAGLELAPLQRALGLAIPEKAEVLRRALYLCRAGWSGWIAQFVQQRTCHLFDIRDGDEGRSATVRDLLGLAWDHVVPAVPGVDLVHGLLNFLSLSAKTLGLSVAFWSESARRLFERDEGAAARAKPAAAYRFRNWFGRHLVGDLERRVGTYNLPYALLIAGHVRYDLVGVSASELRAKASEMRENPDGRLVLLTMLAPSSAYDPRKLAILAENELRLHSPEEMRRPPRLQA